MLRRPAPARLTGLLGITAVAGAAAALLTGGAAPAGATTQCVAYASMPSRVALYGDHVTLRLTLRGSSGCVAGTYENGATAFVHGPAGTHDLNLRWAHFNTVETDDLYPSLTPVGTYTVREGNVQLYDARSERVPWRWVATSTHVRYAGRVSASVGSSAVSGHVYRWTTNGWRGQSGVAVALERRTSGSAWSTVATSHAGSTGAVRFAVRTSSRYEYRLRSASTSTVWGAASASSAA